MSGAEQSARSIRTAESLSSRRPALALAGVTLVWASTFVVTKDVLRGLAPLPYLSLRFGAAHRLAPLPYLSLRFGAAAAVMLLLFPGARRPGRALLRDGATLGLLQALGLVLQVFGQRYTTASKSALVTSLSTALTPVIAFALHGDRPRRAQIAGVALATMGLVLLTWPAGGAAWNAGDLLTLASALVYGLVIVETAHRVRRGQPEALATLQIAVGALCFVALLTAAKIALALVPTDRVPDLLIEETRPLRLDGRRWLQVGYMALVCTVFTFVAQNRIMRHMTATGAALVFALEPVFATGLAIAVEGGSEWPGPRGAAGALLILGGVLASELRPRSRPPHT
jgi:drug/metabolite transporter (DMT)-like permease